jgi:hypothetical protein
MSEVMQREFSLEGMATARGAFSTGLAPEHKLFYLRWPP